MIGAFNSVYTAVQGFFSRTFWFAAFLPVALFAILHTVIATKVLGPITLFGATLDLSSSIDATKMVTAGPVIIVGLIVIAYALSPLMPRFRGMLDGTLLPTGLHDWLRDIRRAEAKPLLESIDARLNDLALLKTMNDDYNKLDGKFRTAYRNAETIPSLPVGHVVLTARASFDAASRAIEVRKPMAALVQKARADILAALAVNNPSVGELARLQGAVPNPSRTLCEQTGQLADQFEDLLSSASREAFYEYEIVNARVRVSEALKSPRATLVGDARYVVERYASDVYRAEFDFLWPRLLVAIKAEKADDPILVSIENAKAQADFAVLSLMLALTVPAIWLPTLLIHGGAAWLFFAIGVAMPLVFKFFYELVFENQLAFGEVVKSTIDKNRLLVLKMLGLPLPTSRSGERRLWEQIRLAEEDGRTADLVYIPPKTT